MKTERIPIEEFQDKKRIAGFEGGSVYTAELNSKYYLISDESTLADFLDEDDLQDMELVKIIESDNLEQRVKYIKKEYGIF